VAGWKDVSDIALGLPGSEERVARGMRQWRVGERLFVWERPLRAKEAQALGERAPEGPILAARVGHLDVKEALIEDDPHVFFTTPHFDGYPAILALLEVIDREDLRELITDAWLARAPGRLLTEHRGRGATK
jgi:hypothetical protein